MDHFKRLFWRLCYLFKKKPKRVHNIDRAMGECEWCKEVKEISINEIWSDANPNGRLVRMCDDYGMSCAGG